MNTRIDRHKCIGLVWHMHDGSGHPMKDTQYTNIMTDIERFASIRIEVQAASDRKRCPYTT